jgi:hypothetical protein
MKIKDFVILFVIFLIYAVLIIKFDIGIPCVFYEITGLYCPGCGITRLCISLFEVDIYQAFRYNPIIFIDVPIIFILFVLNILFKDKKSIKKITNILIIILAVITVIFGVLRNIPAFGFLAPTQLR